MIFIQVNVIEETISYIDALHRRIAERFGTAASTLSQGQVNEKLWAQAVIQFLGYPLETCLVRATGADLTQSSFPSEPEQTLSSSQPVFPTESRIKQKEAKKTKEQVTNAKSAYKDSQFAEEFRKTTK